MSEKVEQYLNLFEQAVRTRDNSLEESQLIQQLLGLLETMTSAECRAVKHMIKCRVYVRKSNPS